MSFKIIIASIFSFFVGLNSALANELIDAKIDLNYLGINFKSSLNNAQDYAKITNGKLVLKSTPKSDFFREPDGSAFTNSAPVLLTDIDNSKPFTFVAKVSPKLHKTYDAGAIYIWSHDELWLKMALEQDERGKSRMVTVRTNGTSDDNNHDVILSENIYMKISSDLKSIGFYYSIDKKTWQLIRVFKNEYPKNIRIGISAQSPIGNGNKVVFEDLSLTQTAIKDFRLGQ